MYALESELNSQPIISLQTGEAVAQLDSPVLDMATFEIQAFQCRRISRGLPAILLTNDIRQYAPDCIIIDDEDELSDPEDIVRLEPIIKAQYSPNGKAVFSDIGRRLGTVEDYTINLQTNRIQRLHVRQSIWKSWSGTGLDIDRTQIIDVTPERITVRDATIKNPVLATDTLPEIQP